MNISPIFIFGCERSGTTLLRMMLHSHPNIAIPDESYFIQTMWAIYPSVGTYPHNTVQEILVAIESSNYKNWPVNQESVRTGILKIEKPTHSKIIDFIFNEYLKKFNKSRWGDKTPSYVESIPIIHQIFPNAKFIHLIRDGRAVCEAIMRQDFGPNQVHEIAKLWRERVNRGRKAGKKIGENSYLEVYYQNLILDTKKNPKGNL